MFCLFLTFRHDDAALRLGPSAAWALERALLAIDDLHEARILTPAQARDRYYDDGPSPVLALQLYFERLEMLERAAGPGGALGEITGSLADLLGGVTGTHQAMWSRPIAIPGAQDPQRGESDEVRCAFMVHYDGEPSDVNEWHSFYFGHHAPIMVTFPDVREVEICTRVDWVDSLPTQRVSYFQRNRIVFDSPAALEAALASETRERMKQDRERFPEFSGRSLHVPMLVRRLAPLQRRGGDAAKARV